MKFKSTIIIAAFIAVPAVAQDSGPFISASAGRVHAKTDTAPGFSANDSYTTWALGGGYRFNRYAGIEASYRDFGRLKVEGAGAWSQGDLTGLEYGVFVAYPVTDAIDLIARAGWNRWQSDWKNSSGGSGTNRGTEPYFGVGASLAFDKRMAAVLNWTRFNSASNSTDDADMIEVGLQYRF